MKPEKTPYDLRIECEMDPYSHLQSGQCYGDFGILYF